MNFSKKELGELKRCINCMIGNRIQYDIVEMNNKRRELNKEYQQLDYDLLERIIDEIDKAE